MCTLTHDLNLESPSYIATGGNDAIMGIWDMKEWMCVRTCSPYEYVPNLSPENRLTTSSETVNWLRFSHDGEWIATVWAKQKEITLVGAL